MIATNPLEIMIGHCQPNIIPYTIKNRQLIKLSERIAGNCLGRNDITSIVIAA